jgi:hypothetical protein
MKAGVITRVQAIEGPFINEWLDWYLNRLNFLTAYLINTEDEKTLNYLKDIIPDELKCRCVFLSVPSDIHFNHVLDYMADIAHAHVIEEWLLHVDTDELLVLPNSINISAFIESYYNENLREILIPWAIIPNDAIFCSSMTKYTRKTPLYINVHSNGCDMKSLMCIKYVTHINHHLTEGYGERIHITEKNIDGPLIYHFAVRSKIHTVLKAVFQQFEEWHEKKRNSSIEIISSLFTSNPVHISKYPGRILIAMYECEYARRANNVLLECHMANTPASLYGTNEVEYARQIIELLQETQIITGDVHSSLSNFDKNTSPSLLPPFVWEFEYREQSTALKDFLNIDLLKDTLGSNEIQTDK